GQLDDDCVGVVDNPSALVEDHPLPPLRDPVDRAAFEIDKHLGPSAVGDRAGLGYARIGQRLRHPVEVFGPHVVLLRKMARSSNPSARLIAMNSAFFSAIAWS